MYLFSGFIYADEELCVKASLQNVVLEDTRHVQEYTKYIIYLHSSQFYVYIILRLIYIENMLNIAYDIAYLIVLKKSLNNRII